MPKNGQYEYPESNWAMGRMAKAGARDMDPSRGYRELEGQRKKRESRVSMMTSPTESASEQTGPIQRDDMHYDELQRQIGMENMSYIREMDDWILHTHKSGESENVSGTGKGWKNWEKLRQQYIDMFQRPDSGVVTHKEWGVG